MDELSVAVGTSASGAAVVFGLTQITKPFVSDAKFVPFIAIAYGVAWNVGMALLVLHLPWAPMVFLGIMSGLSASGVYSTGKEMRG